VKRLLSLVLISILLSSPFSSAATKKINVTPLHLLMTVGTPDIVSGVLVNGNVVVVYGTKDLVPYARGIDSTGKELWNLTLDQPNSSIAITGAVDSNGNIWIAGASRPAKSPTEPTPTPTPTPLNPDSVVSIADPFVDDLSSVVVWKISATGVLLFTKTFSTTFALLSTSIAADTKGASLVGVTSTDKGNAGFLINVDPSGIFSKILQIGLTSTTADGVVRHSDGTLTIVGSSSEVLAGKKVAGLTDGFLIKVSKALKITSIVRSSAVKGKRIWSSASSALLLGGESVTPGKIETAVTKFSSTFIPTWSYRFPSTGPAATLGSTQALFLSTGAVSQLNWNPKVVTPLLLTFDSKGVITTAYSGPSGQRDVLGLVNSKDLGVMAITSSPEVVSIFTLITR